MLEDAQPIKAQAHEQVGHLLVLVGKKGWKDTKESFRQRRLIKLELRYDFGAGFFVEAFGVVESRKQLTFAELVFHVHSVAGIKFQNDTGTRTRLKMLSLKVQLDKPECHEGGNI
jgi:hypothetical protein